MGMTNSAAATAIAILKYQPCAIINQGTSGGHDPALNVFDLVLGRAVCNIGAFKTPKKALGEGADALAWREAFDMLAEDETDPEPIAIRHFYADPALLAAAQHVRHGYTAGQVVEGIIGSADVWNNELDRIAFFERLMAQSPRKWKVLLWHKLLPSFRPFLAIRVVSNNLTNQQAYNAKTGQACQDFVFKVVQHYLAELSKN
jgi:adenosylhomocysteine nucleosidase